MNKADIFSIVFWVLIAAACGAFGFFTVHYLKTYKIFELLWAKIRGQVAEADRLRRLQMKTLYEKQQSLVDIKEEKKIPLISKIYHMVSMSGIVEKIPGFSELTFIIATAVLAAIIFGVFTYLRGVIVGAAFAVAFVLAVFYLLSILSYSRKITVEGQLLDFVNLVALTSRQYSSLVDIFGSVYENFKQPLSGALEACYVEARSTSNSDLAFKHLKDKFDSGQFAFVIDNLTLCSAESGDYFGVATDLSRTVAIYIESFEAKQTVLRNAKITLSIMALLSFGIFYALSIFLGGMSVIFNSNMGIIAPVAMLLLYLYALNMRAD